MWLTRQVDLMRAAGEHFGRVFDRQGSPEAVVMLNGGFWETAGLTAAARRRSIPVIEIQHGVDSKGGVTAVGQEPHFRLFNTAPDAFVAWETVPRQCPDVLCVGPIGLHLPILLETRAPQDTPAYDVARALFRDQADALARRAAHAGARREILVSMQPVDDGEWIARIAAQLPPDVFLWCRRHGSDARRAMPAKAVLASDRSDFELASSSALPVLLDRVGAHLTRFSAVTLEAGAYNVRTVATEPYAETLFSEFVPPSYLTVAPAPSAAAAALITALDCQDRTAIRRLPDISRLADFVLQHTR